MLDMARPLAPPASSRDAPPPSRPICECCGLPAPESGGRSPLIAVSRLLHWLLLLCGAVGTTNLDAAIGGAALDSLFWR